MRPMETQEMLLHFDVSLGCTSESLIGALAGLVSDISLVKKALTSCGIDSEGVEVRVDANKHTKIASVSTPFAENKAIFSRLPEHSGHRRAWDRRETKEKKRAGEYATGIELTTLTQIAGKIAESPLSPITKALALKAIGTLCATLEETTGLAASESHFSNDEGQRILFDVVTFCELLHALNPSAVTSTRVAMSHSPGSDHLCSSWLLTLSQDIPTLDRTWPAPYSDCVGIALLKTVTSRFGSRGETVVARHSAGADPRTANPLAISRALLCYPTPISSRPDLSPVVAESAPNFAINAILGAGADLGSLLHRLHNIGLHNIATWQTFDNSASPRMMLRVVAPFVTTQTIVEALLITGEASEVSTHPVESESLEKRSVSVPFGRGQKMQACRVNEWLWCGKILRADPDPGDLQLLVNSTGYAQEVVRADVLAAWRRWRAN